MKNLLLPLLALVLGVAAGLLIMYQVRAGEVDTARSAHSEDARALDVVKGELASAKQELSRLAEENERLRADEEITRQQLAAVRKQAEAASTAEESTPALPDIPMEALLGGLLAPEPQDQRSEDSRSNEDDDEEERRERWGGEGRVERFREMFQNYLDERLANAQTAGEQERIAGIMEYSQYLAGLRETMQNAETDAEREQAREAFFDGMHEVRQIMDEHRNSSLAELASRFGIADPQRQQAFLRQMENLMRDPLMGGGFMGPGRGMVGGPPDSGFRRGGGGRP
jgi:hypothetical protein